MTRHGLVVAPASALALTRHWRQSAAGIEHGAALFIVPIDNSTIVPVMRQIAISIRARGQKITVLKFGDRT
jgi:hypothetical protein